MAKGKKPKDTAAEAEAFAMTASAAAFEREAHLRYSNLAALLEADYIAATDAVKVSKEMRGWLAIKMAAARERWEDERIARYEELERRASSAHAQAAAAAKARRGALQ